jgi:two-component system, OmpR family, alkaline phosphatase synthesis response regulator PhoP
MTTKRKRILIVDDDTDFITATRAVLAGAGYEVAECTKAAEALARVREFRPDLLVLDVMMETGTAGFDVSYQVRKDPHYAKTPILMVTAIHQTTPLRFSPETDGEFLPVEKLLDKPVPADVLLTEVAHLLESAA